MRHLLPFLLSMFIGASSAAVCNGVTQCPQLVQTTGSAPTVLVNTTWDATGFGGGHTTYCCANVIIPSGATKAMFLIHGGGGDEYDVVQQFQYATKSTTSYTITNAVWSSTYGGSTVFTLSSDPTAGTYGPTLTRGNVFATTGVVSTGGSGAGFNSGFSSPWTVLAVHGGSAPYTVTVAQTAASSPGTYASGGKGFAFTLSPGNVLTQNLGGTILFAPQGLSPLGGVDNAITASFSGQVVGFTLTASTPTSGVITTAQTVSSASIRDNPGISGHIGGSIGYAGQYVLSANEGTIASEAMTSNGCPVAANNETWSNWNSDSCRDDATALDAAAKAITATYSIAAKNIDCLGHSEGSGMCLREMWEHPADFGHFGGISMPFSAYYAAGLGGHTTLPGTVRPWYSLAGVKDPTVCIDVADNAGCGGTANQMHATISGTTIHVQSIDSGAVTPGNWITTGANDGTYIVSQSATVPPDVWTGTVSLSQTIASSTAMNMNNSYSTYIYNNSNNASAANVQFPAYTQWLNYVNSQWIWANGYCAIGGGPQLSVAGFTESAVAIGYKRVQDSCAGYVEYTELSDATHTIQSITSALGALPGPTFQAWSAAHPL